MGEEVTYEKLIEECFELKNFPVLPNPAIHPRIYLIENNQVRAKAMLHKLRNSPYYKRWAQTASTIESNKLYFWVEKEPVVNLGEFDLKMFIMRYGGV